MLVRLYLFSHVASKLRVNHLPVFFNMVVCIKHLALGQFTVSIHWNKFATAEANFFLHQCNGLGPTPSRTGVEFQDFNVGLRSVHFCVSHSSVFTFSIKYGIPSIKSRILSSNLGFMEARNPP